MNKKRVNGWIIVAKEALIKAGIVQDGKINKSFRGQISSFGAATVMGSLKSAIAFFIEQGGAAVAREKLVQAMYYIISREKKEPKKILEIVCMSESKELKEKFIDAAIALKLAMNFFELE